MVIYAFEFFELCDILFDLKFIWDEGDFSVKVYHLLWNTFLMASLELISIGLKVAFSTVIVKFMCSHRDDSKGMGKSYCQTILFEKINEDYTVKKFMKFQEPLHLKTTKTF